MTLILVFILGVFVGCLVGVLMMALANVSASADKRIGAK